MTVANGSVVRITMLGLLDEKDVQNVYHVQLTGDGVITDSVFKLVVGDQIDLAYASLNSLITEDFDPTYYEFFNITEDRPMGLHACGTYFNPAGTAERLPQQVAALCRFGTNTARSQGRKFIGGLTIDMTSADGTIGSSGITALGLYIAQLVPAIVQGPDTLRFGNYRASDGRFAPWVNGNAASSTKTQRRRYVNIGS